MDKMDEDSPIYQDVATTSPPEEQRAEIPSEPCFTMKMLIIGDSAVGKTSLMFRYCDKTYSPIFISTIGIWPRLITGR